MSIFSKGDKAFYRHLTDVADKIDNTGDGDVLTRIDFVKDGLVNYIPQHRPAKIVTDVEYDFTETLKQLESQVSIGQQSIIQFETMESYSPIEVSEKVIAKFEEVTIYQ